VIHLDTDHLTVLKYTYSERHARFHGRLLAAAPELIGTTIINVEEQMRGWFVRNSQRANTTAPDHHFS
jgi:tRNA(fMet)-specific endonuclease VapC